MRGGDGQLVPIVFNKSHKGRGGGGQFYICIKYSKDGNFTTDIGSSPKNLGSDRRTDKRTYGQTHRSTYRGGGHLKIISPTQPPSEAVARPNNPGPVLLLHGIFHELRPVPVFVLTKC